MTHSKRSELGLGLSVLLLAAPLLLGVRSCERVNVGEECDDGMCAGSGTHGAGAGGASGDGSPTAGTGAGGAGTGAGGTAGASGTGASGASGTGVSGTGAGGDGCEHNGEHYELGDTFPAGDGCNSCTCTEMGVACTLIDCDGNVCGGIAGLPCGADQYCDYPIDARCGAADATGTCAAIPSACDLNYQPVCGCDGVTYGNACAAALEGVSVASEGECDGGGSGQTCGGIASLECASSDEFCNYEESAGGQGCDGTISDAAGVCEKSPEACEDVYEAVCGCDRRTYSNACEAHGAGQSVMREGECTELDCEAIGGHAVDGTGPGPMCPAGESEHGVIRYSNGMTAIEGTICCVP